MTNAEIIERGNRYVMSTYGRAPVALVRGEGIRVWDADGKCYLDFVGGLAVNSLGHCHPKVAASLAAQARTLIHCSNLYWIEPQVRLAQRLVELSGLGQAFFCNSGTEANEAAIKLARKYARSQGGPERYEIIAMEKSFHGRTLGALAATWQPKLREAFEPLVPGFKFVPLNDLSALEAAIDEKTCAVMLEPVQGEGGVHMAAPDYLKEVSRLCREKGLLLIFDEVQCGLGRTGRLFAWQHGEVRPDIMTLAKALGGGVPIGAMLAGEAVARAFVPGDHGSTFGGNPLACAAALAYLEVLEEEDLVGNAARVGVYFQERLQELAARFPLCQEVRGRGLILGMELSRPAAPLVDAAREAGLLINATSGNVLRFLPPLGVQPSDVDEAMEIMYRVFEGIEA
ncbi:MAG: acetylornithine transaminase [Clostridia bacterium]|nr:MAG: acetylornithine transaminase [Clostridia bacterium]